MTKKQSKRIIRLALLIGTVVSLYFVPWIVVKAWLLPLPDTIQEQANEAIENGFDGIIIYVDQKNQEPKCYTAGWHDKKYEIPAKSNALFKIASISKLYTAVSIVKLHHQGKIALNKTITDYLPELSGRIEYAENITVEMLVKHRSGIPNYTNTANYWASPKESNQENLDLILDLPANFEPNTDYEYSNTNYLLLSEIMNKVLAYDHFSFIKETILDRLDLKNTFQSISEVDMDRVMSGYHKGHPHDLKTDNIGMLASAEDVGTFVKALNDGTLFDGNEKETYSTLYEYEHKGWVPGYQSIATFNKEIEAVIVQFTSTTDPKLYYWNLADVECKRVLEILESKQPK